MNRTEVAKQIPPSTESLQLVAERALIPSAESGVKKAPDRSTAGASRPWNQAASAASFNDTCTVGPSPTAREQANMKAKQDAWRNAHARAK